MTVRRTKSGLLRLVSKSGKNLGEFKTRAGVEKRERQVQFFKHRDRAKRRQTRGR